MLVACVRLRLNARGLMPSHARIVSCHGQGPQHRMPLEVPVAKHLLLQMQRPMMAALTCSSHHCRHACSIRPHSWRYCASNPPAAIRSSLCGTHFVHDVPQL